MRPQVVIIIVFWAVSLPSSFITILKVGIVDGYGDKAAVTAADDAEERADGDGSSLEAEKEDTKSVV